MATEPLSLVKLRELTERLPIGPYMECGFTWTEIKAEKGTILMRGIFKTPEIAIVDNYASAGAKYPTHSHHGKEYFCVYHGEMILILGNKKVIVNKDKPYYFNADIPHSGYFDVECRFIAVTIPPDKDWPENGQRV